MKKVVFIGFATCYKSSVGRLVAESLNFDFCDTDSEIERASKLTIQKIFDQYGEQHFRKMESELLDALKAKQNVVISCGGGSVLSSNFGELASDSTVVWLTASADTVMSRLGATPRPLFDKLTLQQLSNYMAERNPLYAKYAHICINTDALTSTEVAQNVLIELRDKIN